MARGTGGPSSLGGPRPRRRRVTPVEHHRHILRRTETEWAIYEVIDEQIAEGLVEVRAAVLADDPHLSDVYEDTLNRMLKKGRLAYEDDALSLAKDFDEPYLTSEERWEFCLGLARFLSQSGADDRGIEVGGDWALVRAALIGNNVEPHAVSVEAGYNDGVPFVATYFVEDPKQAYLWDVDVDGEWQVVKAVKEQAEPEQ